MEIRLNKFLSQCGLGSRRKVEDYITSGRITVNGKTSTNPGLRINHDAAVFFDNKKIQPVEQLFYLILNKPRGYITTLRDEKYRPIVMDIIPEKYKRAGIFPVGRLDKDTEGLLLLTNDGDLAYRLTRPEYHVPKEYIVELNRGLTDADKARVEKGVFLPQIKVKTKPADIKIIGNERRTISMIITEGKNRQIRYTFQNMGYKVKKLLRRGYATLTIDGINRGSFRILKQKEIVSLKKLVRE